MAVWNGAVSASADDGELDWGTFNNNATNMLWADYGDPDLRAFMRFTNVAIPQGATVNSATLVVQPGWAEQNLSVYVYGNDADNASAPANAAALSGAALTTARTAVVSTASAFMAGPVSIDVTAIVQEIVDRPGWTSGNSIMFITVENASPGTAYFEVLTYDSAPGDAATVSIDYTGSAAPALSGTGSVSASASLSALGVESYHFSGTGSLSATASLGASGAVPLPNQGSGLVATTVSLAASGDKGATGNGLLDWHGELSSSGSSAALQSETGTGTLSVSATLAASGDRERRGNGVLDWYAELSATGTPSTAAGGAGVTGATSAGGTGIKGGAGSALGEGSADLSAAGTGEHPVGGDGSITQVATATATGLKGVYGTASASATAELVGTATPDTHGLITIAPASLAGDGVAHRRNGGELRVGNAQVELVARGYVPIPADAVIAVTAGIIVRGSKQATGDGETTLDSPDTVGDGNRNALGDALLTALSDIIVTGKRPQWYFSPPTRRIYASGSRFWRRVYIDQGITVLYRGGAFVQVEQPSHEDFATADRVYLGGHLYPVDDVERIELENAGYSTFILPDVNG